MACYEVINVNIDNAVERFFFFFNVYLELLFANRTFFFFLLTITEHSGLILLFECQRDEFAGGTV